MNIKKEHKEAFDKEYTAILKGSQEWFLKRNPVEPKFYLNVMMEDYTNRLIDLIDKYTETEEKV